MQVNLLAFGITKEILGASEICLEISESSTVEQLREHLQEQYPRLADLPSLLIAVNESYGDEHQVIKSGDELALIPPVSGG